MMEEPTVERLIGAVGAFLKDLEPRLEARDAFLARVSGNALALVLRDLEARPAMEARARERLVALLEGTPSSAGSAADLSLELAERIRAGVFDGEASTALLRHLGETAADQVRIDQPAYSGLRTLNRREE